MGCGAIYRKMIIDIFVWILLSLYLIVLITTTTIAACIGGILLLSIVIETFKFSIRLLYELFIAWWFEPLMEKFGF